MRGGNTKIYSGALLRLRERDFERVQHQEGISPEWGLKYRDFEPYYTAAEKLYRAHGKVGEDPTEPPRSEDYPHTPVDRAPRIKKLAIACLDTDYIRLTFLLVLVMKDAATQKIRG